MDIDVHVMDHEGDDLEGKVGEVPVSVISFPLNQLVPEAPLPGPVFAIHSRATVKGVPLAPTPMPLPGGTPSVPPPPTNLPLLNTATLQFTVTPKNRSASITNQPVTDSGLLNGNVEIQIVVPDTSLSS